MLQEFEVNVYYITISCKHYRGLFSFLKNMRKVIFMSDEMLYLILLHLSEHTAEEFSGKMQVKELLFSKFFIIILKADLWEGMEILAVIDGICSVHIF